MLKTIRTTILGGVFFLVPFGILLLIVQEVLDFTLNIAEPIAGLLPQDDMFGIAMANVLAWGLILLTCYLAGLVATTSLAGLSERLETKLAGIIPGYRLIKSTLAGALQADEFGDDGTVVEVHQFGTMRWAFEIERSPDGASVLVFFPGAPTSSSGILQVVPSELVKATSLAPRDLVRGHQYFGRGMLSRETPSG